MIFRVLRPLLLALLGLFAVAAPAHEMSMGEFELRETSRGEFIWQWAATSDKRPTGEDLRPIWPDNCVAEPNLLHCGPDGLQGTFSIEGVGQSYSAVLVKVHWLDGQLRVYTITASQPRVNFYGSADDARDKVQIARAYTVLGIEHILPRVCINARRWRAAGLRCWRLYLAWYTAWALPAHSKRSVCRRRT